MQTTGTAQTVAVCNLVPTLWAPAEVSSAIAAMQIQVDRDFYPVWKDKIRAPIHFVYAANVHAIPAGAWPIYLNKHSTDPGALGWHDDQNGQIFSRVFVGDCRRYGLSPSVTLSHEALELILDPDIKRVWKMPDGRLAAFEACDAVESDDLAVEINGVKLSDFVLPAYFSTGTRLPFDFGHRLTGPCPDLTPGGYMSIRDKSGWTQVQADRLDGLAGRRALMKGWRRQARSKWRFDELEFV